MTEEEQVEEEVTEEITESEPEPEPIDPLQEALERAIKAEKEIDYRDAEIQNIRKRSATEKAELIQYSGMGLARRMLGVLDDLDRAISASAEENQLLEGMKLLRQKLWSELSSDGVSEIPAKGVQFDPKKHEAITMLPPSDDFPTGTIIDVLEAGFMYKQRVLRAARVVVASE